jgi:4a-hydroxytetrahydrobiopterin dehydratase
MLDSSRDELSSKRCASCQGGVEKLTAEQAESLLKRLPEWRSSHAGERIRRDWQMKDFLAGIAWFNQVAHLADQEGHHPDLHLENYRHVWIELWTHAVGGLSENDFILAAKIDNLPIAAGGVPRPVALM